MTMIPLLISAAVLKPPSFFWAGFDGTFQPFAPPTVGFARAKQRPWPLSQSEADAVERFFRPSAGAPSELGEIRLALLSRGKWLDVDLGGVAQMDGRPGSFDVVGFSRFVRASRTRQRRLGTNALVTLRVSNRTRESVSIRSPNGLCGAMVPSMGTVRFVTWNAWHGLRSKGRQANVPPWFDAEPKEPWYAGPWLRFRRIGPALTPEQHRTLPPYKADDATFEIVVYD